MCIISYIYEILFKIKFFKFLLYYARRLPLNTLNTTFLNFIFLGESNVRQIANFFRHKGV